MSHKLTIINPICSMVNFSSHKKITKKNINQQRFWSQPRNTRCCGHPGNSRDWPGDVWSLTGSHQLLLQWCFDDVFIAFKWCFNVVFICKCWGFVRWEQPSFVSSAPWLEKKWPQLVQFLKPLCFLQTYPLVICYIAIENDPVEIVDVPIENGG